MKVFRLNGEVVNIGEWDYNLSPVRNTEPLSKEQAEALKAEGKDPEFCYDENGELVTEMLNPLPEGAVESDEEVVETEGGGLAVVTDHAKLRQYPPIEEQLDYIFHHGVEAWKADMIQPIKDKYPKA